MLSEALHGDAEGFYGEKMPTGKVSWWGAFRVDAKTAEHASKPEADVKKTLWIAALSLVLRPN